MATGNRTLKLSILADVDDLKKKLDSANKDVETSAGGLEKFGKAASAAFAVAAAAAVAYASKLAVDGVKSALEDEQAQLRLASALKTATGATTAQIQATEAYISKTALAVGIADDQLRPAFQRLSVATGDVKKSQDLLNLALDVSKGSGKPLGDVVEALSKSYEGNNKSLAALGIGLTKSELASMSFKDATSQLSDLYGGAASRNAETFQGRIDRLKVGFDEAKESIGYALLPIIEKLISYIFTYGIPLFNKWKDAFDNVKDAIDRNGDAFKILGEIFKAVFPVIAGVFGKIVDLASSAASIIIDVFGKIVRAIEPTINFIISGINKVITGLNAVSPYTDIPYIPKIDITPTASPTVSAPKLDITTPTFDVNTGGISGSGIATASKSGMTSAQLLDQQYLVATFGQTASTEEALRAGILPSPVYNITVNGAIDSESTARQIVDVINQSASRGGSVISTPFML
jgi:hypothetical protein